MCSLMARENRKESHAGRGRRQGGESGMKCQMLRLLWISALLMWPWPVLGQAIYDLDGAAADLAGQVAQHFPAMRGEVVDVQGEQIYFDLGARDHVLEGMRLDLFREGKELTSPTTGEVLARLEERLGTVTVTQVAETYAVAMLENVADGRRVRTGDGVRITAGRLTLALIPEGDQAEGGPLMATVAGVVERGLRATGRFDVLSRARLKLWLLDRGLSLGDLLVPEVMAQAASTLGVAYLAQLVLQDIEDGTAVELRLLAPASPESPITLAVAVLSNTVLTQQWAALPPATEPSNAVPVPTTTPDSPAVAVVQTPQEVADISTTLQGLLNDDPLELERRYVPLSQFGIELRGFDAADIDGDGQSELLMLSDTKVLLYQVQGSQLIFVASYSDRRPGTLLSAQLIRFGAGQLSGVVVNRYSPRRKGMDSFFLTLEGNQLVRQQKGLSDILLAVDRDGDGVKESVWGQAFDREDFFRRGQVRQYVLRDGRLKRQGKLAIPVGFRATGAALAQLGGPGNREMVFVDKRHNLQVYDGNSRRWKSTVDVGGSYVFAAVDVQYSPQVTGQAQFDFEAIPAVADFDGDGIDEVLVPQNQAQLGAVPNLNLYSGGHVVLMRQTPQGFSLSPISPEFDGVVSGVAVLRGSVPGILVAVSKREGLLKQKKRTFLYLNRF